MLSYFVSGYQTVLSWVFGISEQQDSQLVKVFIVGATGTYINATAEPGSDL